MPHPPTKVGDWVRMYDPGIWQVTRVLRIKRLDPLTCRPEKATLVFGKRFVSLSFKKAFAGASCHIDYVRPLTKSQAKKLLQFEANNVKLVEEFNRFCPPPIDAIYNASIGAPKGVSAKALEAKLRTNREFTEFEIEPWLRKHGLEPGEFPPWTVQFVSPGYQVKKGCLAYRFVGVLKF